MTDQPNVIERVNGAAPATIVEKTTEAELVITQDEDKPTFDFGELSYSDVRQLEKTYSKANKLREKQQRLEAKFEAERAEDKTRELTVDEVAELEALETQAEALMDDVYDSVALSITYIPRSWLVKRAPKEIDVTEKGVLRKYLRADRIMDLVNEFKLSQEKKA